MVREILPCWIGTVGDLKAIVDFCQPALTISEALEKSWDMKHVHFLITAEKSEGDEDLMTADEARDTVPELPLQAMIRRKFRVSNPQFHIAANLSRP